MIVRDLTVTDQYATWSRNDHEMWARSLKRPHLGGLKWPHFEEVEDWAVTV
jgi:hypothetical protein